MGSFEITAPLVVGHESAGCVFNLLVRNCDPTESCSRNGKHPTVNKANAAAYMCGFVCYREVVQAGSAVTSLKEGDRVALEPGIPCWSHKMSRQDAASGDTKKRDANSCIILQLDQTTS